jgi:hypothetical protein
MDQKTAKLLTEKKLSKNNTTLLFEIVRAKNSVLSRTPSGEHFGTYCIYNCNEEYLKLFCKNMNKDGFWTKIMYTEEKKGYTVLEVNWKSEYVELPE